jgi:hypothetical protein
MGSRPLALRLPEVFRQNPEVLKRYEQARELVDADCAPEENPRTKNTRYNGPASGKVRKSPEKCGKVREKNKKNENDPGAVTKMILTTTLGSLKMP